MPPHVRLSYRSSLALNRLARCADFFGAALCFLHGEVPWHVTRRQACRATVLLEPAFCRVGIIRSVQPGSSVARSDRAWCGAKVLPS